MEEGKEKGVTLEALNEKLDKTKEARLKDFEAFVISPSPLSAKNYSAERFDWLKENFSESVLLEIAKQVHLLTFDDALDKVDQVFEAVDDNNFQDRYKVGSFERSYMLSEIAAQLFYCARKYNLVEEPYKKEEVLQDFEGICGSVKEAAVLYAKITSVRFSSGTNVDTITSIVDGMSQIDAKTSALLKEFSNKFPLIQLPGKWVNLFSIPYGPFTVNLVLSFSGWSVFVETSDDGRSIKEGFLQKVKVLETMPRDEEWTEDDFAAALEEKNKEGNPTPGGVSHKTRTAVKRELYE
ncbi:MAG: hypothetical protein WC806_00465 [Candidatus Gracilibacteria bacterium]|jgi:hypothetical protein